MKKALQLLTLIGITTTLMCSCNRSDVKSASYLFTDISENYDISDKLIETYYINDSEIPYVDAFDYIKALDGLFNLTNIRFNSSALEKKFKISLDSYYYVEINSKNDTIFVNDYDVFYYFIKSSGAISYNSFLQTSDYQTEGKQPVTFNLGKYGLDIQSYRGKCLIPFVMMNMIFCSPNYYNVFFNGEKYVGFYGEISNNSADSKKIFSSKLNGTVQSEEIRNATINSLCFAMDYYYGLKTEKGFNNFIDYISSENISLLKSTNSDDNHLGLINIFMKGLDELHSRVDSRNVYSNHQADTLYTLNDCGDFYNQYYSRKNTQNSLKTSKLGESVPPVRYSGDTAIISFNSFVTGYNSQIYDAGGNVKEDAWKYDTYWLMDNCIKDIKKHSEIHDILIDLSLNGGGNMGAMYRTFGFISNNDFLNFAYDCLTNEFSLFKYKIDANHNSDYNDLDAYTEYRWTVLEGINTFSAANNFICQLRQQNVAKVIGQRSGGGMCSILPLVLADSTGITISSSNTLRLVKSENGKNVFYSTEHGFEPDLEIPYSDFYTDSKLVNYIDSVYIN